MPIFFILCGGNPVGKFADVTSYTFLRSSQDVYIFGLCIKIINAVRDTCVRAFRRLGYMFAIVCCNSTYCARFQNVSFLEISD